MNKSFTLIEILVVIVVIGVLSAFILVGINSITSKASIAKGQAFANSMRNTLLVNLVSEWKFDNIVDYNTTTRVIGATAGNVPDSWGTNNGTAVDGPLLKEGGDCVSGKCVYFNGTNDISLPSLTFGASNWTVSAWVKIYDLATDYSNVFTNATDQVNFACKIDRTIYGSDPYFYSTATGSISGGTQLKENVWYFLTYFRKDNLIYVYIDGKLGGSGSASTLNVASSTYIMGSRGAQEHARGTFDEVSYFNQSISSFQIQQDYFMGLNSLYKNTGITLEEFNQRLVQLKNNLVKI